MSLDAIAAVKRELLVRHLEAWAPAALHRARRVIYVHGYPDGADVAAGVLADQPGLGRGRELSMLVIGAAPSGVRDIAVHSIPDEKVLGAGLKALGATGVPVLGFLDAASAGATPSPATVAALTGGKPAEVLLVLPPGVASGPYRAGWPLFTEVELATGDEPGELLALGTSSGKSMESFKDALWEVDEFAGVRYRDPGDPDRHLIDISLTPHPGPLRRELLAHLERVGSATVTELRTFALTETVYRAADATRVLHGLVDAGTVAREPSEGRLGGDVVISAL